MVGLSLEPFAVGYWCIWLCHPNFIHSSKDTVVKWSTPASVNTCKHTLHLCRNLEPTGCFLICLTIEDLHIIKQECMKKPAMVGFKLRGSCRPHHHDHVRLLLSHCDALFRLESIGFHGWTFPQLHGVPWSKGFKLPWWVLCPTCGALGPQCHRHSWRNQSREPRMGSSKIYFRGASWSRPITNLWKRFG